MRMSRLLLTVLLATAPALASAQTTAGQPPPPPSEQPTTAAPQTGRIDFGLRGNSVTGDPARFQRFKDLRDGPVLDVLRYTREGGDWTFDAAIDHLGYRDQRLFGGYDRLGKVRVSFEWDQIPLFSGDTTQTAYTAEGEGVSRLPDLLQAAIQSGAATLTAAGSAATPFRLRSRRDIGDFRFAYTATPNTELRVGVTTTGKSGEQAWGAGFAFAAANEVPLELDQRTTDVNAGVEWANNRGLLRVAYDGSLFSNDVQSIVFDSPLRITDAPDAPSQGRMSIFPSSTAHTVSGMGSIRLPARSRAHAYLSIGQWSQDEPLLPHTINTALPTIPLDRSTAEAEARIVSLNLGVNSRPTDTLWLNARARLYDYDNRTPHFVQAQYVRADSAVATSVIGGSEPFGYTRNYLDLDASFTPLRFLAFRAGYGREHDDRTFRFVEKTTEHTIRASIDSTGFSAFSVRAVYEHARRVGEGFDEEALSDIGEQVSLRQFDISDRNRDRLFAVFQATPLAALGLTAQVGIGRDNRPDAEMGLQDNDLSFFTVGLDVTPSENVFVGVSYGRENYATLQRSRQANPGVQFNDPTRDWSTDMDEHVDTVTANLDFPQVAPKATVRFGYDYNRSNSRYVYVLAPNSTLVVPEQLPPVKNALQRAQGELIYDLTRRLGLGFSYWYERYDVDDFAFEALTPPLAYPGSGVFLGYIFRDYTAHVGWVRLIVNW